MTPDGRIEGDTQGGYALALSFDLLPEDLRPKAAAHLVENIRKYQGHLSTGIQTTHRAMLELTRYGYHDIAWQLLTNRSFPSWFYMIDNGATTIWERWDGYVKGRGFQDAGMNSFNHWAFGAVGEWIWRNLGGINPDDTHPGFKRVRIQPRPSPGLTWVKATYESPYGRIVSDWRLAKGAFHLRVQMPPNSTALVYLPTRDPNAVREGGLPASRSPGVESRGPTDDGFSVFHVNSGDFSFTVPLPAAWFQSRR